jgi:hypothetical protein
VVVLATLGAPQRRLLRGRRGSALEPEATPGAAPVTVTRATIIATGEPLADEDAGRAWVLRADEQDVETAIAALNAVVAAHRLSAADPGVREVARAHATVVRVAWARGDQAADGRLAEGRELPPSRPPRRKAALAPQERTAALLGAREPALACEELLLRARGDLAVGRTREAALQAGVALRTALAELGDADAPDMAERRRELTALAEPVALAAQQAATGEPDPFGRDAVTRAVERLAAALRARAAATPR